MVIELSALIASLGLAVAGPFTFWKVQYVYDFYIPIVLFIAGYIGMLFLWWLFAEIYGIFNMLKKEHKKVNKFTRFLLNDLIRYVVIHSGARVTIINKDKIPTNERFLFVQNHISKFDPMVTTAYLGNKDIAFITKPDNFKIPLAKRLLGSLFYQAIDREDPIQSLNVMKRSIELIQNNITSIGVYPEGTRHQDLQFGEFHEGVFNICLKAKCPLVVTTIKNTDKIHKNFPFKPTKVTLNVIGVISYEEMENMPAKALSDHVHKMMESNL